MEDMSAIKPDSWDESEDGVWERPLIPKPRWRRFCGSLWKSLEDACPWLLLGLLCTAALQAAVPFDSAVLGHLRGAGAMAAVKGSVGGLLSPLCSCGAMPIALGLVHSGTSPAAAVAFMVAAQAAGIDSLMFTVGVLGTGCALLRLLAAFLVATVAGLAVPGALSAADEMDVHHLHEDQRSHHWEKGLSRALTTGFDEVALPLLFGFALTSLLEVTLPAGGLAASTALGGFGGRAAALGAALPLQFCEHASVPLAVAVQKAGATGGLAFAVLATLPSISAASAAVLLRVLGFLGVVRVLGAIWLCGLALSFVADGLSLSVEQVGHSDELLPTWFVTVSKPLMGVIAVASVIRTVRSRLTQGHDNHCHDHHCKGCKGE